MTTVDGLMDHLLPLSLLKSRTISIQCGQTLDLEELKSQLAAVGYERMAQVDGMGQFSIRGGIVDIFPLTEETPIRIELWDDEVDSIRSFDTLDRVFCGGAFPGRHLSGSGGGFG